MSQPQEKTYPPSAFRFTVGFGSPPQAADCWFDEVNGLADAMELETVAEDGANRFVHQLPKSAKHPNLVLRRGICAMDSRLVIWCREVLEGGLGEPIKTQSLTVSLINATGQPLRSWRFADAFPVKWEAQPFDSRKSEIAMERVEMSYSVSKRVV